MWRSPVSVGWPSAETRHVERKAGKLTLGLRPEHAIISVDKPAEEAACARGIVREVAFYGESTRYHVEVAGLSEPIIASLPNLSSAAGFVTSQQVWVALQPEAVIDLGHEATASK